MATSNFELSQAQLLLEQAQNLSQINQNILRVKENLSECCQQIGSSWQSDTADKDSYLKGIQDDLQKIETLTSAIFSLSNHLTAFAQRSIATANNS